MGKNQRNGQGVFIDIKLRNGVNLYIFSTKGACATINIKKGRDNHFTGIKKEQ